jgi:subtilisin family serine protease
LPRARAGNYADQDTVQLSAQLPHVIAAAPTAPAAGVRPDREPRPARLLQQLRQSAIDLAAPGGSNIDCSLQFPPPPPRSFCSVVISSVVITLPCFAFDTVVGPTINGFSVNFGTSAATPHVAGAAALLIGAHGGR